MIILIHKKKLLVCFRQAMLVVAKLCFNKRQDTRPWLNKIIRIRNTLTITTTDLPTAIFTVFLIYFTLLVLSKLLSQEKRDKIFRGRYFCIHPHWFIISYSTLISQHHLIKIWLDPIITLIKITTVYVIV
jgi:hypothetical protein